VTTAVVLDRNDPWRAIGLVTVEHLLQAHLRDLAHERHRERVLLPRMRSYRDTISTVLKEASDDKTVRVLSDHRVCAPRR
jgi:hypothetical protein